MDRRSFLQAGVVAGAAGSSCVGVGAALSGDAAPAMLESELAAMLLRLDSGMAKIGLGNLLTDFLPDLAGSLSQRDRGLAQRSEELGRKSMRMLLLTGAVRDLPPAAQLDARVQQRIEAAMPEMDEAMLGVTESLSGLSAEEKTAIKQALRERPELLDDIGQVLDRHAQEADVPLKRRLHLRALVKDVGWRMQRQSPGAVIDQYVEKVRKVEARHGDEAQAQRALAAQVTERLLWAQDGQSVPSAPPLVPSEPGPQAPSGTEVPPTPPPPGPDDSTAPSPEAQPELEPPPARRGKLPLTVGGILLGFGVVTLAVTGIAYATTVTYGIDGKVFAITAGAVLAVAGLIVMLVGAILWAVSKPKGT